MITVEGLTKRYANHVAVDNISFKVERGQIVGFLGPNGAGKTTTMRVLTCFLPPTSGTARVAEFDVLEQPMEVKKRIGYLPETPPLYPEMEVVEYLEYVGRLKGVPKDSLARRVDEVAQKCSVGDVKNKLIGKLSKGYRQRVGLAQAIIHNPDVLILDEPTSGLDPQQIIETRDLIKGLAGDHTIILSTHILPEVEQLCERVIIIAKGKLVATDTVQNLTSRLRGAETVSVEIAARNGMVLSAPEIQQRLERVEGVSRVLARDAHDGNLAFTVESQQGQHVRPELARAVIEGGWNLNELHAVGLSLEEIFLELTGAPKADVDAPHATTIGAGGRALMNTLTICRKELNSYFRSPIAYGVMFFFAVITGYFFYAYVVSFVTYSIQSSMQGQSAPMSVNDQMIRPLLSNLAVIGLFFIPIITMRLFAEEKRTGTFELLATSPVTRHGNHPGQMAGRGSALRRHARHIAGEHGHIIRLRQAGLAPHDGGLSGTVTARRMPARNRHLHLLLHAQPDRRRSRDLQRAVNAVGDRLGIVLPGFRVRKSDGLSLRHPTLRFLFKRRPRYKGCPLLRLYDFHRLVFNRAISRIAALEGLSHGK